MPRLKIEITGKFLTKVEIPVRITDINYGNHTGNDSFVAIIHEARMLWLTQHKYTELNIEGVGLIMSSLEVQFLNESFYGDVLLISIYVDDIGKKSFDLLYEITTLRESQLIILAKAITSMVTYNYTEKKVATIPYKLQSILGSVHN